MRRRCILPLLAALLLSLTACGGGYQKYSADYVGHFDVNTSFTAFARSKAEFNRAASAVGDLIAGDARLYDIYHNYDGINNLKTINDNAGIAPVPVDTAILDLLEFCVEAHKITNGLVNVAMGSVLRIWHDYRIQGIADAGSASIPSLDVLRQAAQNIDITNMVIDRQAGTVFLSQPGMSLDVGSIAKGFTAQRALEAAKKSGLESILINMGGNVVSFGQPMDGRHRWAIGIQNPNLAENNRNILDTVYVNDMALVSSGDYQRYYTVAGVKYNHIIDPQTLMPAMRFTHVTVIHADSGTADALSTAMFILPQEKGRALLEQNGAEGLWVSQDGTIDATPGFAAISQKLGGYSAKE